MQVIFLPNWAMIVAFFVLWPIFQVAAALFSLWLPDRYLNPDGFLFRERKWEKGGKFYQRVFHIKAWKGLLPDGGAAFRKGYRKKKLYDPTPEGLRRFLIESCRAELTHLLAILPFWIFGLFAPAPVIGLMLLYALIVNLPCMIAQRYNRPRIVRVIQRGNSRIL